MTQLIGRSALSLISVLAIGACAESRTEPTPLNPEGSVTTTQTSTSSVRWNRTGIALFRARGGGFGRVGTYLSLAQYRAVRAAAVAQQAGAAAGASVVVLQQFYPLDSAAINLELDAQRAEQTSPSHFDAGALIGRQVGTVVLALAATDQSGTVDPGAPPVGPGYWISNGTPTVRGGLGTRPFFLTSGTELRLPPPPAFGSLEYLTDLAEVRAISDTRTPEQLAIAQKWAPFSGVVLNGVTTNLIDRNGRTELEAARVLAYANAAAFDAGIACFDTKFAYWLIRPSQSDPAITTPVGLPNHPSFPSAHSCESGAFKGILMAAFPNDRGDLTRIVKEASISRVYGGIHYRFDIEAGEEIGGRAARLALSRQGLE